MTFWYGKHSVILVMLPKVVWFGSRQSWSMSQRYQDRDLLSLTLSVKGYSWRTEKPAKDWCLLCAKQCRSDNCPIQVKGTYITRVTLCESSCINRLPLRETIPAWAPQPCVHWAYLPPPCSANTHKLPPGVSWNVGLDLIVLTSSYA